MDAAHKKAMVQNRRIKFLESKKNKTEDEKKEYKSYIEKMLVGTGMNSDESCKSFQNLFPQ